MYLERLENTFLFVFRIQGWRIITFEGSEFGCFFLSDLLALAVQKFPLKHFFCRRQPSKFYESLTAVAWDPCDSGAIFRDFIDSLVGLLNRFD